MQEFLIFLELMHQFYYNIFFFNYFRSYNEFIRKRCKLFFSYSSMLTIKITNSIFNYIGESLAKGLLSKTTGGSCLKLATDKGEGVVRCSKCIFCAVDLGSPIIYSIYMLIIVIYNKYFKLYISNVLCYKYSINNYY